VQQTIEKLITECDSNKIDINNLTTSNVSLEDYIKNQNEVNSRFRLMEFSIKTNQNYLISTDEYIDK